MNIRLRFAPLLFAAALFSGCGDADANKGGRDRPPPLVQVEPAASMRFVDRIDAVGTAHANEQVTLSAPVTERIERLYFDDGAFVRRGQTIAVLRQGQQTAQLSAAQAQAQEAQQQLARVGALKERGFATQASYDAQLAAARSAQAQAQQAQASIGDRIVRAPFSGWVSLRNISAGTVINQGTGIATISDVSTIKLDFPVPETLLAAIQPGLTIEARAAAYPDQPFRGQIANIDPVVDPNSRAVMVRARIPNPDRKLRPGMMMTVGIETAPRLSLSVPELAIVGEGDSRYVYVVDDENTARRVQVRTGLRSSGRVEILEGLEPGQRVVTEGVVKLSDGMQVRLAGADNARPEGQRKGQGAEPTGAPRKQGS
jgi:membrane fusion protein, multidrug efflux system